MFVAVCRRQTACSGIAAPSQQFPVAGRLFLPLTGSSGKGMLKPAEDAVFPWEAVKGTPAFISAWKGSLGFQVCGGLSQCFQSGKGKGEDALRPGQVVCSTA